MPLRRAFLILIMIVVAASAGMPAPGTRGMPNQQDVSILSAEVRSFQVENETLEQALRALREVNHTHILFGFEKVARRQGEEDKTVSLSLSNSTLGEILDALCQQDRRYTYETVEGRLIHVYPRSAESDPVGLLGIRIARFSIRRKMAPSAVIERIGELAPELASYLRNRQWEYYARRGVVPGSPGANMSGNMDPQITLNLQKRTVREILNAVALYSYQLNQETPPDWTGYKLAPTSWIYEFIIDPAAPSGLRGTPHWKAF